MTIPESPAPAPDLTPAPKKNNTTTWIIVAVVAVVLVCCLLVALVIGGILIYRSRAGQVNNIPPAMPFLNTPNPINTPNPVSPNGTPAAPGNGPLTVESFDPTNSTYPALQDLVQNYKGATQPSSQNWNATVPANQPVVILLGWCTSTTQVLDQNYQQIKWSLTVDGQPVDVSKLFLLNQQVSNPTQVCKSYSGIIRQWTGTTHKIVTTMTVAQKINDGFSDYAPGDYTDVFTVNVTR